jgi:predicted transcriptional regulator
MTNRSKIEIMSKILKDANGDGATHTKITYSAFLSYSQVKGYLKVLTQNDLLSYDFNTRIFKTTEKGLRFIEAYNQMEGMMKALPTTSLDVGAEEKRKSDSEKISMRIN